MMEKENFFNEKRDLKEEKNENIEEEVDEKLEKIQEDTGKQKEIKTEEMTEEEIITDMLEGKINTLEEQLDQLEDEKDTLYKKAQRLKADFINFRKRSEKEKMGIGIQAKIEIICDILPVVDNFERALSVESEDGDFKKGVEMIYKQLINTLKQEGLTEISTIGEEFNHKYHEAVAQVEDSEEESGIIIEEIEKGYQYQDRIVRPAKVIVAK